MTTHVSDSILKDRYLLYGETREDLYQRVASYYADDKSHESRLRQYLGSRWFLPATPILSNGGTDRGECISCFVNEVGDSLGAIVENWNENIWMSAKGGGIGTYWGKVRSIGESVRGRGETSGIIPFIGVQNSLTLAISQGSLRRGSSAVYLDVAHPEIEEFITLRRPSGGDLSRKALNVHHCVILTDEFMIAVKENAVWNLRSPATQEVVRSLKARELWIQILNVRLETGEPYLLFIDTVNAHRPEIYKRLGLNVKTSNLCNEIVLTTGTDHLGNERVGTCNLLSVNLEKYDDWSKEPLFIEDLMRFMDNVQTDFIRKAPSSLDRAKYAAHRERSVGLGVMGLHSYALRHRLPFFSSEMEAFNREAFQHIRWHADRASVALAKERGACPDALDAGLQERFTHKLAVAPTASISLLLGVSPCIEPFMSNAYTQKTLTGSFPIRNPYLREVLHRYDRDSESVWGSIINHGGSVQHLDFLSAFDKELFLTAHEVSQLDVIRYANVRAPYIDQSQSLNIFIYDDITPKDLHAIHYECWKTRQIKGMYYCRPYVKKRLDVVSEFCSVDAMGTDGECDACQ